MQAIRIHTFGEPEVMQLEEVPDPQPGLARLWYGCMPWG